MKLSTEHIQQHNNIVGFTPYPDLVRLNSLLDEYDKPGAVGIEIGCLHGRSSWTISKTVPAAKLVCIDVWDGFDSYHSEYSAEERIQWCYPSQQSFNTKEFFLSNVRDCQNIEAVQGHFPQVLANWNTPIDFIFIDALHKNPEDRLMIDFGLAWLKTGGTLCGHDYNPAENTIFPDLFENVSYLEKLLNQPVTLVPGSTVYSFKIK